MLPMNNDNCKDYQAVLEEQTPLVCNDAVENKSSSTRLATLVNIRIAVFAFLAMAGQYVSHANSMSSHANSISGHTDIISELKAALADHQSQLQALTVQSTPLLSAAIQGSAANGDQCVADNECGSGACLTKPYAFCGKMPQIAQYSPCDKDRSCTSGYCSQDKICLNKGRRTTPCKEDKACTSGKCTCQESPWGGWSKMCE